MLKIFITGLHGHQPIRRDSWIPLTRVGSERPLDRKFQRMSSRAGAKEAKVAGEYPEPQKSGHLLTSSDIFQCFN